jgi:hypothetical protein
MGEFPLVEEDVPLDEVPDSSDDDIDDSPALEDVPVDEGTPEDGVPSLIRDETADPDFPLGP